MKLACVTIVKNEERHIAEWIAYQLAIGFDTIILFDNQSSDHTVTRAQTLAAKHDVRILDWPVSTPDYQLRSYEHAVHTFGDEFTWMAFFDTDEFLVIDPPFDLRGILNLWTDVTAIGVPWAMFGSSSHVERPDGQLIESFLHRSEPSFGPNRHIKSIIRPGAMRHCENAHVFAVEGEYRSLSGMTQHFSQDGLLATDPDYTMGKLHHYFIRSRAHWADKMRRGYHDTTREATEFELYDRNEVFDDSALRIVPQVEAILAETRDAPRTPPPSLRAQRGNPLGHIPTTGASQEQASPTFLKESSKELLNPPPRPPPSLRAQRGNPSSHKHAIETSPDHATSLLPEPSVKALLTAFGTLLTWNPTSQTISHKTPGALEGNHLVLWRCASTSELVTSRNGRFETLDPMSGQIVASPETPLIEIVPGERAADIAVRLENGAYLSARPASAPHESGPVDCHVMERKAWECFTPIEPAVADLIARALRPWLSQTFALEPDARRAAQPIE